MGGVALDANNTTYRGQHLWVAEDPPLHGTSAKHTWLLKHAGTSNRDVARAARFLTNHFPSGAYRARFNVPGPQHCPCGGGLETRSHILFRCPYWIRTKTVDPPPLTPRMMLAPSSCASRAGGPRTTSSSSCG